MSWFHTPEWIQRECEDCGCNILEAGGDPDHGRCYECWQHKWETDADWREEQRKLAAVVMYVQHEQQDREGEP